MRTAIGAPLGALFLLVAGATGADEIYRWVDEAGRTHYGDRPPPQAERLETRGEEDPTERFRAVEWIPDGDTIHLADGTEVRLIGLNAPEVAHRDEPAEPGGPEAQRFLRRKLEGQPVRLETGAEVTDDYGRTLAHVFTGDGTNINRRLLHAGHAFATFHPPNTERAADYFAAEREARQADRGIWARPHYAIHPAAKAGDLRNTFRRIRGRVAEVQTKRKYIYLAFDAEFQAILTKDQREQFAEAGKDPEALTGRTLVVRGWIHLRDGVPGIRLRHPLQIESPA